MTISPQKRAADDLAPVGPAAKSCPCVPRHPVAAGQGDRPPAGSVLEAARLAGPDVPGGAAVEESRSHPLGRTWALALPAGLQTLSLNGRLHWAEQRRRAAELKKAAWAVALRQKIPHLDSVAVTVVYHPPDKRRRDHDNIPAASGKHCIDGLVAAGVLDDDCPPNVAAVSYAIGEIVRSGQLVLHISEVTA